MTIQTFGDTSTDAKGSPAGSGYTPETSNADFTPMQLGKRYTGADGKISAPARVEMAGGTKATYTYAISATAPYATPTDWILIRGGANTAKIVRIEISGAATAATEVLLTLKKHTIANTGGSPSTPAFMKHDSNDPTPTTVIQVYTAAPTIDASATIWKTVRLTLAVAPAATANNPDRYVYEYGAESYEPLTLRGVTQELALNFAGVAVPAGGVYDVAITVTEDLS